MRERTKTVQIGSVAIGGGNPVAIQSMCNTKTEDWESTVNQILRLERAGCEIVRVAVPTMEAAKALREIKSRIHIPLVADIHFDYRLAIASIETGRTRSASTREISEMPSGFRRWWTGRRSGIFPSASGSTAVPWRRSCWPNTAESPRRAWWRAPCRKWR